MALSDSEEIEGLVTYVAEGDECEIVSLDAVEEGAGIGTALLERAVEAARAAEVPAGAADHDK